MLLFSSGSNQAFYNQGEYNMRKVKTLTSEFKSTHLHSVNVYQTEDGEFIVIPMLTPKVKAKEKVWYYTDWKDDALATGMDILQNFR